MLKISIKQLVNNHWRMVLVSTASVALSACVSASNEPQSESSSSSQSLSSQSSEVISSVQSSLESSEPSSSSQSSEAISSAQSSLEFSEPSSSQASVSSVPVIVVPSSSSVSSASSSIPDVVSSSSQPVSSASQSSEAPSSSAGSSSSQSTNATPSLLGSPGTFDSGFEGFEANSPLSTSANGEANFEVSGFAADHAAPWDVQLWHAIAVESGEQYTICYDAKAATERLIEVNIDDNDPTYQTVIGGTQQGAILQAVTTSYERYSHTILSKTTTDVGRLTFNMAQANGDVQLDNIGVYAGSMCGQPGEFTPEPPKPPAAVGWTIEKIGCNDPDDYSGEALVLFDGTGNFDGVFGNKAFNTAEFANLSRQGASDYVLGNSGVSDPSCDNNRKVHNGTWLKKLADADSQHSNFVNKSGFGGKTIGDMDSVVIELRVNSDLTDVPTKQQLLDQYEAVIGADGVNLLDNGNVSFAITLGDPDATTDEVRAEAFLEIDQDLYRDEWIRISIPKDAFFFWQNENWNKTPVSLEQANTVAPTRIAFNPETKGNGSAPTHGYTVRNVYGYAAWETLTPKPVEDFKEMNISIRTFEVRFEPTTGIVDEPVVEEPVAEEPIVEEPIVEEPTVEEPQEPVEPPAPATVSEAEKAERIAAGKDVFLKGGVNCAGCHGTTGEAGVFGTLEVGVATNACMKKGGDTSACADSYEDLVSILTNGVPGTIMPGCQPAGNCAEQIADYVWGGISGRELPVK